MEIQFLGTGAGLPSKNRNVTAIALKLLDEINQIWLFDCGEATQHQILRTTIKPRKIQKIFITHLHGDHIFGLPGFLSSRSFQGGAEPLTIYGPKGIREFIMTSLKISQSKLTYPLEFVEFDQPGQIVKDEKFNVYVTQLDHGVLSYGFRIEEKDHPGELQAEQLHALGVPYGPLFGQLKAGQTIMLEDGRTINGKEYISTPKKGRTVTIFGDTRYQKEFVSFAKHSDVIVYESTFEEAEQPLARRYFHSTTADAAKLAKEADAKQLLLTHISARYLGSQVEQLEKEAQAIFEQTTVVKDFDTISIPLS